MVYPFWGTTAWINCKQASEFKIKPLKAYIDATFMSGKIGMVVGHPGQGKSTVTLSFIASSTSGKPLMGTDIQCAPGSAIIIASEDDPEDTMIPRLIAQGADIDKVYIFKDIRDTDDQGNELVHGMNLGDPFHLEALQSMVDRIEDVVVIVIDPISAYLGRVDSHNNAEVRALLTPLSEFAAKNSIAIICVSHLNKSNGTNAIMKIAGSTAFVAAARAAYLVAPDKDNPEKRLFIPVKNNLGNDNRGMTFQIEECEIEGGIHTSRVIWDEGFINVSADDALSPLGDPEERGALDAAKEFLVELLSSGPVIAKQVYADAKHAGHSEATVKRAKALLPIKAKKRPGDAKWEWSLIKQEDQQE